MDVQINTLGVLGVWRRNQKSGSDHQKRRNDGIETNREPLNLSVEKSFKSAFNKKRYKGFSEKDKYKTADNGGPDFFADTFITGLTNSKNFFFNFFRLLG